MWSCRNCGEYVDDFRDRCPHCGANKTNNAASSNSLLSMNRSPSYTPPASNCSKVAAVLLAFFLGGIGAHRYYLGYKKAGIIQTCGCIGAGIGYGLFVVHPDTSILFLLFGVITGIWAFVDFIRILTGGLTPADSPYYAGEVPYYQPTYRPATSAPATLNRNETFDLLERLAKLREQGILTDEEFQQQKADILSKL